MLACVRAVYPCVVRSNSTRDPPLLDLPQLHTRDPQKRRTAVPGWMLLVRFNFANNLLPKKGDCGPGYVCSWCAAGVGLGRRTGSTSSGPWLSGHHGALAWCMTAAGLPWLFYESRPEVPHAHGGTLLAMGGHWSVISGHWSPPLTVQKRKCQRNYHV